MSTLYLGMSILLEYIYSGNLISTFSLLLYNERNDILIDRQAINLLSCCDLDLSF